LGVTPELVWDCACRLGEGALWHAADASLYFVDIKGRELLAYTPADGTTRRWPMPQKAGWIVPRARGGWLAGLEGGIAALRLGDPPELDWTWLHRLHPEGSPMRLNDAAVDPAGRLWFGTMNNLDESRPDGVLYRLDPGGVPQAVDTGYGVTNGPTFGVGGRTLWHTDSVASTVYAFDLDPAGGLSNKRPWLRFGATDGFPDGMTTDAEGMVWIAHWDGGCVTRHDPSGRERIRIRLPAPRVTKVAFGGVGLTDLYVTTARAGLDDAALAAAPAAGGLFVVRGAGRGIAPVAFAG
jgi:sugar lactone lactonase YvrE